MAHAHAGDGYERVGQDMTDILRNTQRQPDDQRGRPERQAGPAYDRVRACHPDQRAQQLVGSQPGIGGECRVQERIEPVARHGLRISPELDLRRQQLDSEPAGTGDAAGQLQTQPVRRDTQRADSSR